MKPSPQTRCIKNSGRFIFSSFLFILFLCILSSVNEIRLSTLSDYITKCINPEGPISGDDDQLRILIGILTVPGSFHRRNFLRQVYGVQHPVAGAKIDVKFVFCNITDDEQKFLVSLEILHHNDIIILNCTENMNLGKSFNYFSSLPATLAGAADGDPPYHYVMKADDDTYIRLGNLAKSLTPLPREDLYYGYVIPCESMNPFHNYMSGMGYLVSWDIVEWLGTQARVITPDRVIGPEDKVFWNIMRGGNRGKNRFNEKPGMYNYPDPPDKCSHELWPGTVAVHLLKTPEKWIKTLRYFNVTQNLKPSSFYPIDQFL